MRKSAARAVENQTEHYQRKFQKAHNEGPEEYFLAWFEFLKGKAKHKSREDGHGQIYNKLSGEFAQIYRAYFE